MEIVVTARHKEIGNETKQRIADKLAAVLDLKSLKVTSASVVLDFQKSHFTAEVIVKGKHLEVEAKAETDDLMKSVDEAVTKAEKQILKYLKKRQDHQKTPMSEDFPDVAPEEE